MIVHLLYDDSWTVPVLLGVFSSEDNAKAAETAALLGHPSLALRIQSVTVDA